MKDTKSVGVIDLARGLHFELQTLIFGLKLLAKGFRMSIECICHRDVDTAEPDETILKIAQRMHARKVGSLVVVNTDHEPIGMITDRDLATRVIVSGRDASRMMVHEAMTAQPAKVNFNADVKEALRTMRTNRCRRLPVVDRFGKLMGIVSLDDLLVMVAKEFQMISSVIAEESPQGLGRST